MEAATRVDENLYTYFEAVLCKDHVEKEDIQRLLDAYRVKLDVDFVYVGEILVDRRGIFFTHVSCSSQRYNLLGKVHTFREARRVRDNFYNRLIYHAPGAKIMLYMGRGKNTHRIHFHMISEGVPEDLIRKQWTSGSVLRIENLREHNYYNGVDRGRDYTGLANYLFNHWTPEVGGHRWKGSRKTLKKPDYEEPTTVKRNYTEDKPPRPPKGYIFVEATATKYGYLYYKYVLKPPPRKRPKKRRE